MTETPAEVDAEIGAGSGPGSGDSAARHLRQVARGAGLSLVGSVVSAVTTFGLVLIVARVFDSHVSGVFFAASAVFLILAGLTGLGVEAGLARFAQRLEHDGEAGALPALMRSARNAVIGTSIGTAVVLALAADPLGRLFGWGAAGPDLLLLVAVALPCAVLAEYAQAGTRAFGRMHETVVVDRIGRSLAQVLAVLLAGLADADAVGLLAAWLAWYPVSAVWSLVALRRFVADRLPADLAPLPAPTAQFWSFTWPRALSVFARLGIQKVDIVLVAALLSPVDAALYAAATRFVALGQIATTAITQVLQPRFTTLLLEGSHRNLTVVHQTATAWNVLLSWPLYLVVGCAPSAYLALFGADYDASQARWVVVVMTAVMLVSVVTGPVDTLLVMGGRSATSMINTVVALVVDLTLCFALIPAWGITGAAVAWGSAVLVKAALALFYVRRELGVASGAPVVFLACGLCLLTVAFPVLLLTPLGVPWPASAAVAVLSYSVGVALLRRQLQLDVLGRTVARKQGDELMGVRKYTSTLRRSAPDWLVRTLRCVAFAWGWLTADFRMQPDIVVVGAQRCGTTTLFRMLESHPHLVRPTQDKGTGYFDDNFAKGSRWYRAHFPLKLTGRLLAGPEAMAFECSGYYLFHPLAAERLAAALPRAQVVVLVRDPVERAMSAHRHELARGFEELPLDEALSVEGERLDGEVDRLVGDPGYRSYTHRHHAYLARGEYGRQISRFVDTMGAERVHVVDADAFFDDPAREYAKLQRGLGIPVYLPERVERWNARPGGPRLPRQRRESLLQRFEDSDAELEAFLGGPPAWRRQDQESS
ncbi:sulfotransferase [Nocardioides houyundeii]|uniref:sulfotransferase n=1 Tax=Nocardioides houyundeii TaxID=2045452 RepID=UPI000DF41353|nr:sulfotransferase [Nocardioides houyundeii]